MERIPRQRWHEPAWPRSKQMFSTCPRRGSRSSARWGDGCWPGQQQQRECLGHQLVRWISRGSVLMAQGSAQEVESIPACSSCGCLEFSSSPPSLFSNAEANPLPPAAPTQHDFPAHQTPEHEERHRHLKRAALIQPEVTSGLCSPSSGTKHLSRWQQAEGCRRLGGKSCSQSSPVGSSASSVPGAAWAEGKEKRLQNATPALQSKTRSSQRGASRGGGRKPPAVPAQTLGEAAKTSGANRGGRSASRFRILSIPALWMPC